MKERGIIDLIHVLTPTLLAVMGVSMTVFGMTSRVDEAKFNTASNISFALIGGATAAYQQRDRKQSARKPDENDPA